MAVLTQAQIVAELALYGVDLSSTALQQLAVYLELLVAWNRRIRLTGLREPRRLVRELFGESLFLARRIPLQGWLVDVGSGAGFPGLALKLAAPDLEVTLVEARTRKCAFLKEVARRCGFTKVEVVGRRLQEWAVEVGERRADIITTRAVRTEPGLLQAMEELLRPDGRLVFFTTQAGTGKIRSALPRMAWDMSESVPGSVDKVVLSGTMA